MPRNRPSTSPVEPLENAAPDRVYHLVKDKDRRGTDFRSQKELVEMGEKPRRKAPPTPEEDRQQSAPSAWDSLDAARQLAERFPSIGAYVATLDPSRWAGVRLEALDSGHYLMWGDADSIASGEIWPRLPVRDNPS